MYEHILNKPLEFGEEFTSEARAILTGLLNRDPSRRLGVKGAEDIKRHPFFHNHIDFKHLAQKKIRPPFKPSVVSPVVSIDWPTSSCQQIILTVLLRMYPTLTRCSQRRHRSIVMSRTRTCLLRFKHNSQVGDQHPRHNLHPLLTPPSSPHQDSRSMVPTYPHHLNSFIHSYSFA
jgi:hypothetical protein